MGAQMLEFPHGSGRGWRVGAWTLGFPLAGDFLGARRVYEELADLGALRAEMEQVLAEHNQAPGAVPLRLVLFRDAIEHSELGAEPKRAGGGAWHGEGAGKGPGPG